MQWAFQMGISISLGLIIAIAYLKSYRGFFYSKTFVHSCVINVVLVNILVSIVINTGKSGYGISTALAFSLVGFLGLIRFRTVVRDTREFSYVLLSIVTGVGVGSGNLMLATLGCLAAAGALIALDWSNFGDPRALSMRIRIKGQSAMFEDYQAIIGAVAVRSELIACRQAPDGSATFEYDVVAARGQSLPAVTSRLQAVVDTTDVSAQRWNRGHTNTEKDDG